MGPFKVPMMVISLIVLLLLVYSIILKFQKSKQDHQLLQKYLNALIVVGSFNFALGMVGQISAVWASIDAIRRASDINPDIIMTGILISFGTTIYGLITFMVACLAWLVMTYLPVRK